MCQIIYKKCVNCNREAKGQIEMCSPVTEKTICLGFVADLSDHVVLGGIRSLKLDVSNMMCHIKERVVCYPSCPSVEMVMANDEGREVLTRIALEEEQERERRERMQNTDTNNNNNNNLNQADVSEDVVRPDNCATAK